MTNESSVPAGARWLRLRKIIDTSACSRLWLVLFACTTFASHAHAQATDNFDRANGGLGANWHNQAAGSSALQIVSNQLTGTASSYSESFYDASFGGAQFSQVKYVTGLSNAVVNLIVRGRQYSTTNTEDGYVAQLNGFANTWRIIRFNDQVETELESGSLTAAANDIFYFEANGSTLTLKQNGATLRSTTDPSFTTGDVGIGIYTAGSLRVDDWSGGDITLPPSGTQAADDFNRANGGLGSNWHNQAAGSSALQIVSSQLTGAASSYSESFYDASFGGAQFSQVKYIAGLSNAVVNLMVRGREYSSSNTQDGYFAQLNGFAGTWRIIRFNDQVETELESGSLTASTNDIFYFEANGSTLTLKQNGATLRSVTDTSFTSGDVGVGIYTDGALRLDDWSGGEISIPQSSTQATDDFNRANGGLGTNWHNQAAGSSALQIASNQLTGTASSYSESFYAAASFAGAQFSQIKYVSGFSNAVVNLFVRGREYSSTNTEDGYFAQLNGFANTWRIMRLNDQVETEIESGSLTASTNDIFYFEANGSTLTLKQNGATLRSVTDTSFTSGDVGVGIYTDGALRLDDWNGGEIGASSDTLAPSQPSGLSATAASSSQIDLSWGASTDNVGVNGYRIERCQGTSCSNFVQITTVPPSPTTYNDTGLTAATVYIYRVRAIDAANNASSYSTTATATTLSSVPPGTPSAAHTIAASNSEVDIGWAPVTGATGYLIERCQGSGCTNFVQIGTAGSATFFDVGLAANTTYVYRVRSQSGGGQSGYSTSITVVTLATSVCD